MISITNHGDEHVHITTGSKEGVPTVEVVKVGETRNVRVDATHPAVTALKNAGLISISEARRGRAPNSENSES